MTALSTLSVDDLVDTATARLSEAEDALRELAKRDPEGNTRLGARVDVWRREMRSLRLCIAGPTRRRQAWSEVVARAERAEVERAALDGELRASLQESNDTRAERDAARAEVDRLRGIIESAVAENNAEKGADNGGSRLVDRLEWQVDEKVLTAAKVKPPVAPPVEGDRCTCACLEQDHRSSADSPHGGRCSVCTCKRFDAVVP